MLPFTTQIIEVVAAHYPPNMPSPADLANSVAEQAQEPTEAVPVKDPDSEQAQTANAAAGAQLTQQTAFPGLQASKFHQMISTLHGYSGRSPNILCLRKQTSI